MYWDVPCNNMDIDAPIRKCLNEGRNPEMYSVHRVNFHPLSDKQTRSLYDKWLES